MFGLFVEATRLPVQGAVRLRAVGGQADEAGEAPLGLAELSALIGHPALTPAPVPGHCGGGKAFGKPLVDAAGARIVLVGLVDAADGVQGLGRQLVTRELLGQAFKQDERPFVLIGIPQQSGPRIQGPGAVRGALGQGLQGCGRVFDPILGLIDFGCGAEFFGRELAERELLLELLTQGCQSRAISLQGEQLHFFDVAGWIRGTKSLGRLAEPHGVRFGGVTDAGQRGRAAQLLIQLIGGMGLADVFPGLGGNKRCRVPNRLRRRLDAAGAVGLSGRLSPVFFRLGQPGQSQAGVCLPGAGGVLFQQLQPGVFCPDGLTGLELGLGQVVQAVVGQQREGGQGLLQYTLGLGEAAVLNRPVALAKELAGDGRCLAAVRVGRPGPGQTHQTHQACQQGSKPQAETRFFLGC